MKICGTLEIINGVYYQREKTRGEDILHKTEITIESVKEAKRYLSKLKCLARNNIRLDEYMGVI